MLILFVIWNILYVCRWTNSLTTPWISFFQCLWKYECQLLLSCQPRVTVMSCFVYKVIRDLELINHLCINPIHRIGLIHKWFIDSRKLKWDVQVNVLLNNCKQNIMSLSLLVAMTIGSLQSILTLVMLNIYALRSSIFILPVIIRAENSMDPDQMTSSETSWSGSTTVKPVLSGHSKWKPKLFFKTD